MSPEAEPRLVDEHQRFWRAAWLNGALWALGNGFVSSTIVVFFAKELGAAGHHVGWILAFPQLFGVFRLLAPWLLDAWPQRQTFAVLAFTLSAVLLLLIPFLARESVWGSATLALWCLVALWGGWHLLMYLALVPFYSWLGDAGHHAQRTSRLATRELAMLVATIVGMLAASQLIHQLTYTPGVKTTVAAKQFAYSVCILLGGAAVLLSVWPLLWVRHTPRPARAGSVATTELFQLLNDRRYWPLLVFNAWFSLANGFTASALAIYPYRHLALTAVPLLYLQVALRGTQAVASPAAGDWLRRSGHRFPLVVAQLLVSAGVLFYLVASADEPWWIVGATACWTAYVVLNIGLPSIMLRFAPGENSPTYIAATMAISGVAFAAGSIWGGDLLDQVTQLGPRQTLLPEMGLLDGLWRNTDQRGYLFMFMIGFVLRVMGCVWLCFLPTEQPTEQLKELGTESRP